MLNNQKVKYSQRDDHLSMVFMALADPTRRAILAKLSRGDATVNELAEPFSFSLPAISKHLKVLERAQLISRGRDAQYRPCHIETKTLKEVADWMNQYRTLWEDSLSSLSDYIDKLQMRKKKGDKTNG